MSSQTYFNDEEKDIIESIEKGEISLLPNESAEKDILQKVAEKSLKKKKAINIRILENDIQKLKSISYQKGLPYQTLIASVLHQYAQGKIKESTV